MSRIYLLLRRGIVTLAISAILTLAIRYDPKLRFLVLDLHMIVLLGSLLCSEGFRLYFCTNIIFYRTLFIYFRTNQFIFTNIMKMLWLMKLKDVVYSVGSKQTKRWASWNQTILAPEFLVSKILRKFRFSQNIWFGVFFLLLIFFCLFKLPISF